jgi:hypothetical protein
MEAAALEQTAKILAPHFSEANGALLVIGSIGARDESEMNRRMATQDARDKRVKPRRRPIGARGARVHQRVLPGPREDLEMPRSPADRSQYPVTGIGLGGQRLRVRLFETEFEEVA